MPSQIRVILSQYSGIKTVNGATRGDVDVLSQKEILSLVERACVSGAKTKSHTTAPLVEQHCDRADNFYFIVSISDQRFCVKK